LHLLSAFSHELGIVLSQRVVGSKTNEIPEARRMLEDLTLEGKLVTVDALHTQRDTAQAIVEKRGPM
jgi:predicted transposase YbfD/YdcC